MLQQHDDPAEVTTTRSAGKKEPGASVPESDDQPSVARSALSTSRTATVTLTCAWVVVATGLQLIRGPGHRPLNVIWAEDGGVFLNQAMRHSLWHNLITPHAGYLQVIARLLAQPAAAVPLALDAAWLAASAALTVAVLSVVVWFASGRILHHTWARLLVTALLPLLPQAGFEVNAAINDLHWYLAYAAFWVLLAAPRSLRGQVGAAVVLVVAALSDPLTALVLPAAAIGAYRAPRRGRAAIAPLAMLVALAAQGWIHLVNATNYHASPTTLSDLPKIYALRVATSAVTGDRLLGPLYERWGPVPIEIITTLVVAGLLLLLVKAGGTARVVALAALASSVAYLVVPIGLRGTAHYLDPAPFGLGGSRYTIVPLLLLWTAATVLLDQYATRFGAARKINGLPAASLIGIVLSVLLSVQLLSDWAETTVRSGGPTWDAALRHAAAECRLPSTKRPPQATPLVAEEHGKFTVPIVPGPNDVTIPIAPTPPPGKPLLFAVVAPCSDVLSANS